MSTIPTSNVVKKPLKFVCCLRTLHGGFGPLTCVAPISPMTFLEVAVTERE